MGAILLMNAMNNLQERLYLHVVVFYPKGIREMKHLGSVRRISSDI